LISSTGLLRAREDFSARLKEAPTHSNLKLEVVQMEKVKKMTRMKKKRKKKKKFHTRENEWMILSDRYL
jgi:hypothetical protein